MKLAHTRFVKPMCPSSSRDIVATKRSCQLAFSRVGTKGFIEAIDTYKTT